MQAEAHPSAVRFLRRSRDQGRTVAVDRKEKVRPLEPTERIRVLVADDQDFMRRGMQAVIESLPDMTLVAAARSGDEAVRLALELVPDVVVMDLRMRPGIDGVEATRRIVAANPAVPVVVLTLYGEDELVLGAIDAGARGYVLKGASSKEIERAIRSVADGQLIFGSDVANVVASQMRPSKSHPQLEKAGAVTDLLTAREVEVLYLVSLGLGDHAVGTRLGITAKTVRNHMTSVVAKLGLRNRTEAVVVAKDSSLKVEHLTTSVKSCGRIERPEGG